jgi:SWI/SNF-related matrix-associated actin-dependent regulator of chromatin subfamily A3
MRAEPFSSLAQFRNKICLPFEQGEDVARERLILLYDSLVLRRTKEILKLPDHQESVRELRLTEREQRQYNQTMKILNRYMRTQVGHQGTHLPSQQQGQFGSAGWNETSRFGLFQAHLQLRNLCNHGTFQRPFSWKKRDLKDEREALVGELGGLGGVEAHCDGCRQPYSILGGSSTNGFGKDCKHVLCHECVENCTDLPNISDSTCPLCKRFGNRLAQADDDGDLPMSEDQAPDEDRESDGKHGEYFYPTGESTKMNALVEDVKKDLRDTKRSVAHPSGRVFQGNMLRDTAWCMDHGMTKRGF